MKCLFNGAARDVSATATMLMFCLAAVVSAGSCRRSGGGGTGEIPGTNVDAGGVVPAITPGGDDNRRDASRPIPAQPDASSPPTRDSSVSPPAVTCLSNCQNNLGVCGVPSTGCATLCSTSSTCSSCVQRATCDTIETCASACSATPPPVDASRPPPAATCSSVCNPLSACGFAETCSELCNRNTTCGNCVRGEASVLSCSNVSALNTCSLSCSPTPPPVDAGSTCRATRDYLPADLLPRCRTSTLTTINACTTGECVTTAIDADPTPPLSSSSGATFNCRNCIDYQWLGCASRNGCSAELTLWQCCIESCAGNTTCINGCSALGMALDTCARDITCPQIDDCFGP